jgi:hypothetical protein
MVDKDEKALLIKEMDSLAGGWQTWSIARENRNARKNFPRSLQCHRGLQLDGS